MRIHSAATLFLLLASTPLTGCNRFVDAQVERNLTRAQTGLPDEPGLHVVLCGTGSPLADAARAGACTAVLAGGEFFLVDAGPGSWERVDLENLPLARLSGVLLTHFHSDHIGDLGEAMTGSWIAGRPRPLDIYGPAGTAQVVAGLQQLYAHDVDHRVAQQVRNSTPR